MEQKKWSCLEAKSCARRGGDRIQGRMQDGGTEGGALLSESPSLSMLQETCLAGEWSEHSGAGHVQLCVTEKST